MALNSEEMIKKKYKNIIENNVVGYSLVAIALKNFRDYCHRIGHEHTHQIISISFDQLQGCMKEHETIVHMYHDYFLCIINCPAELDYLHQRAPEFHYAIRDKMNELFHKPLYVEMGFYPILDFDVTFENAQYFADLARLAPHNLYPESNYDMYNVSIIDRNEVFLKLEHKVQGALDEGCFKLYLQPKVSTETGEVLCAEALMRWIDPIQGMIPLTSFLPNLEDNGQIRDVDIYLFEKACQYIEKWKKQYHKDIQISFNLSRAYFNGQYFLKDYEEVFKRYDIGGKNICIELLESVVLNDWEQLNKITSGIEALGFDCALDDFGSGFSSFDIFANVALSEIKLDHSLFKNFNNEKEHILLKFLIELAHNFGMRVVAEGIETKEYADYLKEIHCDFIQGYYYYKPMPIEEFEDTFIKKSC